MKTDIVLQRPDELTGQLAPFKEICRKICLNIPENYKWTWDGARAAALMTLSREDSDLVFFPLFKEFKDHWDFISHIQAETIIARLIKSEYGMMPGQSFFTSQPICGLVLFVAWWPWGNADKVSMRIGLFSIEQDMEFSPDHSHYLLNQWIDDIS
ncbi:MAG: hypothetical protein GY874_12125 [Desulfobacteraceae bacterium]|nr:hypothetical protein [Desulfobacteraceae bacterium]